MEVIRGAMDKSHDSFGGSKEDAPDPEGIIVANPTYSSRMGAAIDPWRRTISQISMGSFLEPELSSCKVTIEAGETMGPFYDRHRTYHISVSSHDGGGVRRYKDFEWLRYMLVHKYPFRIIPQIPYKRLSLVASEQFLVSRRRGLEEFLFLVVNHPILQKDQLVVQFLSAVTIDAHSISCNNLG